MRSKSSTSFSLTGAKVPGNESSWEREFEGTKVSGSESSIHAPGSESAWNESSCYPRKGTGPSKLATQKSNKESTLNKDQKVVQNIGSKLPQSSKMLQLYNKFTKFTYHNFQLPATKKHTQDSTYMDGRRGLGGAMNNHHVNKHTCVTVCYQ